MSEHAEQGMGRRANRWRIVGWGSAAALLLLPLIAMQFTDEVNWSMNDFIVFGIMLVTAGGLIELAAKIIPNKAYRTAVGVAVIVAFILIWVDGAVGIF